ncbi:MAG TPA: type II toxin-antitoxin system VapC family toxin [Candidatus Ozemobacteraceae bacterium]|nr:type II toxin-antitoxin system VapC family toxin [Candidatus Ozemobacteraceae bacterium]
MSYLLDTNICVRLLNGDEALKKKVKAVGVASIAITNGVLAELFFGAFNSRRVEENIARIEKFARPLTILADSQESARFFGRIKAELRKVGKPSQDFDLLIASIALSIGCTLVTGNKKHFESIPGLRLETWHQD